MLDIAELRSLHEWREAWEHTYKLKQQNYYLFSVEYEQLWETLWNMYDALEAKRIANLEPRLRWQRGREKYRARIDKRRKQLCQTICPEYYAFLPLSIQFDRLRRVNSQDRRLHWKSTYDNWLNFRESFKKAETESDHSFQSPSRKDLSPIQRSAHKVLEDWWAAKYCSAELLDAVRLFLAQNRNSEESLPEPESEKVAKTVMAEKSYYHQVCFYLFLLEFNPRSWEPNTRWFSLKRLSDARFNAGCLATAQVLSYKTLLPDRNYNGSTYPNIVPFVNLSADDETYNEKPRWLWSVDLRETIYVPSLPSCPPYTCISHTWGRWRKTTSVPVNGVREWLVPENELYDVCDLPQKLSQLPFGYVWLDLFCIPQDDSTRADEEIARQTAIFRNCETCIAWMHDVESWDDVKHGVHWLSLQYLKIADKVTNSHIPNERLQGSTTISEEFPPSLLHQRKDPNMDNHSLSKQNPSLDKSSREYLNQWEPSTWFSSLWTLQEAILCPRIELYSKDWCRLEDNLGAAIPLVSFILFLYVAFQGEGGEDDIFDYDIDNNTLIGYQHSLDRVPKVDKTSIPTSVRHLHEFGLRTRVYNLLLVSSPVSIIFNANARRCTGDRAPAIMSAIGVTNWYTDRLKAGRSCQETVADLVLGTYPLDFVQEASKRSGACFFETSFLEPRRRFEQTLRTRKAVGTMLPFSAANRRWWRKFGPPEIGRTGLVDHPAVSQWVIGRTGTVEIKLAGILCSTQCTETHRIIGSLLLFEERTDMEDGLTDDLHARLRELAGARTVHAVVLYQDGLIQHGTLLWQEEHTLEDGPSCLVRIGMYWNEVQSVVPEMAPESSVDWLVL